MPSISFTAIRFSTLHIVDISYSYIKRSFGNLIPSPNCFYPYWYLCIFFDLQNVEIKLEFPKRHLIDKEEAIALANWKLPFIKQERQKEWNKSIFVLSIQKEFKLDFMSRRDLL